MSLSGRIDQQSVEPRVEEPDGAPRIASLDVIRGVAILSILFMNINEMGGSIWASFDDIRHFGWTPADQMVWWLRETLADGTARGLLQLLFGAGMLILTDAAARHADDAVVVRGYLLRNLVLLVFGLVHLFLLLWPGDILHTYAIAAMIVVFARGLPPRAMLTIGLSTTIFYLVGGGLAYAAAQQERTAVVQAHAQSAAGTMTEVAARTLEQEARHRRAAETARTDEQVRIVREDAARTGGFRSWAGSAWATTVAIGGVEAEIDFVWEAAATMLVGAALYRWGIMQGARSRRFYAGLAAAGYAIGLPLRTWSAMQATRFDGGPNIEMATYELARLTTMLGHLGLLHWLLATGVGARLLRPFAAAGRTALSIYILQTLACLWLLYPPFAFGLYGRQSWTGMMATALAVNFVLLLAANWWVGRYRVAPIEWAWRSIVEGRRLPFRTA